MTLAGFSTEWFRRTANFTPAAENLTISLPWESSENCSSQSYCILISLWIFTFFGGVLVFCNGLKESPTNTLEHFLWLGPSCSPISGTSAFPKANTCLLKSVKMSFLSLAFHCLFCWSRKCLRKERQNDHKTHFMVFTSLQGKSHSLSIV